MPQGTLVERIRQRDRTMESAEEYLLAIDHWVVVEAHELPEEDQLALQEGLRWLCDLNPEAVRDLYYVPSYLGQGDRRNR